tara:strand:+ start:33 stop:191 length:159 start_codon:yes stop_codon:yes gene_type:complete
MKTFKVIGIIAILIVALVFGFSIAKVAIIKKDNKTLTRLIAGKVVYIRHLVH